MVIIELHFLAGRFHATPWDRHVNEGAVEWPISPWRILRALMAVGYRKLGWDPQSPPQEAYRLIDRLSEEPPRYWLPPASMGHSRHYMPKYRSALDGKTDRVIDAFVAVSPEQPVIVHWPNVELGDAESRLLREMLNRLTFLGRAESWVEAALLDELDREPNAIPSGTETMYSGGENVSLFAPVISSEYLTWREGWLDRARMDLLREKQRKAEERGRNPESVRLTPREISRVTESIGENLFDAMLADTGDLRIAGWNRPPGSQWVDYVRPSDCFVVKPTRRRLRKKRKPTVARFALTAESVQADVRPRLVDALFLADNMRKALMSLTGRENDGEPSETFSGKSSNGQPLKGHQHAFFLPVDDDRDGRIDSVIVFAPRGFSHLDQVAMGRLRRLWQHGGRPGLLPVLTGMGVPEDFGGVGMGRRMTPVLAEAQVWESRTPFVLTRHPKVRRTGTPKLREDGTWVDGPKDQLLVEIIRRELPRPQRIEWVEYTTSRGKRLYWRSFAKFRREGRGSFAGGGYGFRIVFPEPVRGPIAVGYGCHFGLGQFAAVA